jgi:ethanolamine utilization protein EutA
MVGLEYGRHRLRQSQDEQWITSVGIDIGTSTTKMIVSRLKLSRTTSGMSMPRYEITDRELIYLSPIHNTPLQSSDEVDAERIWTLLDQEFTLAGVRTSEIQSGAVIITGETANKRNAQQIVHRLAERSGDFVVATAGADLEGVLAGKGAGAEARSRQTRAAVLNIDVGGGTANAAAFHRGRLVATITFHVGGRLIELDRAGRISKISPSLRPWLTASGYHLETGQLVSLALLEQICSAMSREMLEFLAGRRKGTNKLLIVGGESLNPIPPIEEWMISGGIGWLMENTSRPQTVEEVAIHQDIGPLLAHVIRAQLQKYPDIRLGTPKQTARATVIGAGMQTTEISGATVHLDLSLLPIRNLPVLKLELMESVLKSQGLLRESIRQTLRHGANLFDSEASPPLAIALSGLQYADYARVQLLAEELCAGYKELFPRCFVIVVISENDMAKALGQALERRLQGSVKVICIDQIQVELGDYVDLGEPIRDLMLPVVVKTLAFNKKGG